MRLKAFLATAFLVSLTVAFAFAPVEQREHSSTRALNDPVNSGLERHLRLLTWNIGNGDLETETRAHSEDLAAVAAVIIKQGPDAVALQELTGADQLNLLLTHLGNRYRGNVCSRGQADRVEAVLFRVRGEPRSDRAQRGNNESFFRFSNVALGERFAAAGAFRLSRDLPEILLVSAHADAFHAARRRVFVADVVDWTRGHGNGSLTFIAGDFNLEVSTGDRANLFTDDIKHDSESYAYLLKYFRDLGVDAGETSINDRRIDYIFGPVATVSRQRVEVLRDAAVGSMDHWPLLVDVDVNQ
jgi:endonuclease/exonuclease/phosphatase family metal-dependent hydrolase